MHLAGLERRHGDDGGFATARLAVNDKDVTGLVAQIV